MPRKKEQELWRRARKMKLGLDRARAYVYGTLRKMGWKPKREKK